MSDSLNGVTPSERLLSELCQRSFLRLWSYANPHKDDGHEFCDVIAVFENHVFIFFDREKVLPEILVTDDPMIRWNRWKRDAIDRQITTANGAERYIKSGRRIYLDAKKTKLLPVKIDLTKVIVHKIVVAHGAAEACKNFSDTNVYGSLAISYHDMTHGTPPPFPFMVALDKERPIHIFDTHNLPIIFRELDTVKDFSDYLDAKIEAIRKYDMLTYCGEEDLLANYWMNLDKKTGKHFVGVPDGTVNVVMIGEGEWKDLIDLEQYKSTKTANQISYFWDDIIQRTCDNWLNGRLLGDADLLRRPSAIFEMAKEPRFMRRILVEHIKEAIENFPKTEQLTRHMRFFRSFYSKTGYVFIQVWIPPELRKGEIDDRSIRREMLRIACGAAKNKFPDLEIVVGIAIEPPRMTTSIGEDFIWMDCRGWTDKDREEILDSNRAWGFFDTGKLREGTHTEFVAPQTKSVARARPRKPGRNDPCPCRSGLKFKRCHGR
ncbi:SEC-C domain-containing protein [Roseomonas sp. CECT 9278]|uniref:SEC-C domain-containing protein n=1 Tax=Roseomonas sp. CECT 9278 TaxID=2845823 RepID=UPI001EF9C83B|nr:SEC-C domain-containing protein [Roseomonas sp. CECT 9278]CAH0248036.1 hypothetical protein ROS9278_03068 [Roseomonas sp. CECT 9278]